MAAQTPSNPGRDRDAGNKIAAVPGVNQPRQTDDQQPLRSEDLLRGGREVQILHGGEVYRLTLTRAGKLILHK